MDCKKYCDRISLPPLLTNFVALQHLLSQMERSRRIEVFTEWVAKLMKTKLSLFFSPRIMIKVLREERSEGKEERRGRCWFCSPFFLLRSSPEMTCGRPRSPGEPYGGLLVAKARKKNPVMMKFGIDAGDEGHARRRYRLVVISFSEALRCRSLALQELRQL